MDCLEAQALISAAHDGEKVEPKILADAVAHCDECEDCRAFRAGLAYVDAAPTPVAPPAVIDATLAAIAAAAAERASAERFEAMQREVELLVAADALPGAAETPSPEQPAPAEATPRPPVVTGRPEWMPAAPARPEWLTGIANWFGTLNDSVKWAGIGAAGALAATALIALIVVGTSGGPNAGVSTTAERDMSSQGTGGGLSYGTSAGAAAPSAAANPVVTTAPDYVVFESRVYTPGALLADSSTATPTIGTVKTAFATGGGVQDAAVYGSPIKDGSIVISGPDGFRLYSPVVRRLSSKRYQLIAGNAVERFGTWPTLPTRFATPQSPDGSPTFAAAGKDSLGVDVFAAAGQPLATGLAVAPGTSASDPAGGNPNWTWWEPID